jgi:hypothetical protein
MKFETKKKVKLNCESDLVEVQTYIKISLYAARSLK